MIDYKGFGTTARRHVLARKLGSFEAADIVLAKEAKQRALDSAQAIMAEWEAGRIDRALDARRLEQVTQRQLEELLGMDDSLRTFDQPVEHGSDAAVARKQAANADQARRVSQIMDLYAQLEEGSLTAPQYAVAMFDVEMNADQWFALSAVTDREAALLLSRVNPFVHGDDDSMPKLQAPLTTQGFGLLRRTLRDVANDKKGRTLADWLTLCEERKLPVHWWVTDYVAARAEIGKPIAPVLACEVPRPLQRQQAHDQAILAKLKELGFDAHALPAAPAGKPSPAKQQVKAALCLTTDVMNKAWQRLRADGAIKDA
jgi:hypothetical protein